LDDIGHAFRHLRSSAEWGNKMLKSTWRILNRESQPNDDDARLNLVELCVRLNNFRARRMKVGQLGTVMAGGEF